MRKLKKVLLAMLAMCVILSFSGLVNAEENTQSEPDITRISEIVEKRESNSKTYLLSDGSYEWVGYAEDVHYLDENGDFQNISNRVTQKREQINSVNYAYKNEANSYTVRFADNITEKYPIYLEYQGKSVAFNFINSKSSEAIKPIEFNSEILSDMIDVQNCVMYQDAYQDIDLIYESNTYGIKEYIVLNKPTDINEFYFNTSLNDLSVKEDDGNIIFIDEYGNSVFYIEQLFAIDSNEISTKKVTCDIIENDGETQLKITIDKEYLDDDNRVYPIIIDPSVMITGEYDTYDTYASGRYKDNNYYLYDWLRTGRDSSYYTRRSFIKFDLPTNIDGDDVTDAYLRVKMYSGATPNLRLYRPTQNWTSSTLTWNNMPTMDDMVYLSAGYIDSGSWWKMDVTESLMGNWLDGVTSNYGLMFRDLYESGTDQWTTFYSSDADYPNKPELHIVYTVDDVDITSISPASGYMLLGQTYALRAYVSGGDNPTVELWHGLDNDILLGELTDAGSYYSLNLTPSSAQHCEHWGDTYFSSLYYNAYDGSSSDRYDANLLFICGHNEIYYEDVDSTFYYNSITDNSFIGGRTDQYNCAAYAVGVNDDWYWDWSGTNPTLSELGDFMAKTGAYSARDGIAYTTSTSANGYPKVIYYSDYAWGTGDDGHFAKVMTWDANGYPNLLYSKWGYNELIKSSGYEPFSSQYGSDAKAFFK